MRGANPYSTGGMVTDPAMFFGREEELRRIRDQLRKGASTAVVGLRRIGKSSLLYQLAQQADQLPPSTVAAYLDLQEATHHEPLGLLNAALQKLDERLNGTYGFTPVTSLADFTTQIRRMAADGYHPVLCVDEMEELTEREAFDDDFFEGLRSLGNQRLLAYVTASGESLDVLIQRGGRTSQFYNLFLNLDLAGLSDEAARALLREPFQRAGLPAPPEEQVAYVLDLAGHYPFYLQMAAIHLFEMRQKGGVLDRLALREAFARDAERHFRGLWRHLSAEEQAGVKRLAILSVTARNWESTRISLFRCGLAEGKASQPRVFSDVLAEQVSEGFLEMEEATRSSASDRHKPLVEAVKASVSRPTQRLLIVGLTIISLAAIALLLFPGLRSRAATLHCAGEDYVVSLDYPSHLAHGDKGRIECSLHNSTDQPITATLSVVPPPDLARIDGQSSITWTDLKRSASGTVFFYRRSGWRQGTSITPTVELQIDSLAVDCAGNVAPVRAWPIPLFNRFLGWLFSGAGLLGYLGLFFSEYAKEIGKKQAG